MSSHGHNGPCYARRSAPAYDRADHARLLAAVCARPAPGVQLCHNATFGVVLVNVDSDIERAMVLRIGGPHPQVVLFERAGWRSWLAPFRLCQPGLYTALVRLIKPPTNSAFCLLCVFLPKCCLSYHFCAARVHVIDVPAAARRLRRGGGSAPKHAGRYCAAERDDRATSQPAEE